MVDNTIHPINLKSMAKCSENSEGLGGGGGGPCSLVSNKIFLVSPPKNISSIFGVPCSLKYAFLPVFPSFIFLLFPCSLKVTGHVPFIPQNPWEALNSITDSREPAGPWRPGFGKYENNIVLTRDHIFCITKSITKQPLFL